METLSLGESLLGIDSVKTHPDLQVREITGTFKDHASDMVDAAKKGELPPITLNQEGLLIDGHHRLMAHKLAKLDKINCEVINQTTPDIAEGRRLAICANARNAMAMTRKEKIAAVWENIWLTAFTVDDPHKGVSSRKLVDMYDGAIRQSTANRMLQRRTEMLSTEETEKDIYKVWAGGRRGSGGTKEDPSEYRKALIQLLQAAKTTGKNDQRRLNKQFLGFDDVAPVKVDIDQILMQIDQCEEEDEF